MRCFLMNHHSVQELKNHSCIVVDDTKIIQIHLSTRIEELWKLIYWGAVFLFVPSIYFYLFESRVDLMVVCVELIVFALGLFLKINTNNYYVLDLTSKGLLFHRHFFRTRLIPIVKIHQIQAVAVSGHYDISEFGSHWVYHVVVVLPNRKRLRLTDHSTDLSATNRLAKDLGSVLGCPYYKGKEKMSIVINPNRSSSSMIEYQENKLLIPIVSFIGKALLLAVFVYGFFSQYLM